MNDPNSLETLPPANSYPWSPATTGWPVYRERLLAEKAHLESELRDKPDTLHATRAAFEDQPALLHDQFLSIYRNNIAYAKWKEIEAALDRFRSGQYGLCQECETPLSERRLQALPWARYCIACQENLAPEHQTRKAGFPLMA
jgi:DnaK suppressor protein